MTPAKKTFPTKKKQCWKSLKDTERRGMVGDDDLNVDQHQAKGQHNLGLKWMDTLIGHTCAAGSGGNGQHPSLGAP